MFHHGVVVSSDGEVTLHVGETWAYVSTPGPAFFVRAVLGLGEAAPRVRLLGDRELALTGEASAIAGWGPDQRLYLWLARLPGPAVCLREAHQALVERLVEGVYGGSLEGASDLSIDLGRGRKMSVVMLTAIPSASAPAPIPSAIAAPSSPQA